jgi:hypothetical protein
MFNSQKYVKLIAAVAGAVASSLVALGFTGGHLTTTEIVNLAIAGVGAFQVWYVSETSDNPNGKAIISGVAAALIALQSFVSGGGVLNAAEWLQIGVAALTAMGILGAPGVSLKENARPTVKQILIQKAAVSEGEVVIAPRPQDLP